MSPGDYGYLEKSDKNDPIVKLLKKTIKSIDPRPIKEKHLFTKIKHFFHQNFFHKDLFFTNFFFDKHFFVTKIFY